MADTIHLLSVLNLTDDHLERLRAVSPRLEVQQIKLGLRPQTEKFSEVLTPNTEILYTFNAPFSLQNAPGLRWVQTVSAGVEQLRDTELWASDLAITNASGVHAVQIGEYVLGMLLSHAHHFPESYREQFQQHWVPFGQKSHLTTRELRSKTLGILGYGAIGREVARLASAFGMHILATKRHGQSPEFTGWTTPGTGDATGSLPERFFDLSELPDMLPLCDMLVLALPLSEHTHHLLGAAELALLPSHAVVVNIGRGSLIDHDALVTALQTGQLGGAALDVTEPEPLPSDNPLWKMEQVSITPHISGLSAYYDDRVVDLLCANLQRYLSGEPLFNLVQRALGY